MAHAAPKNERVGHLVEQVNGERRWYSRSLRRSAKRAVGLSAEDPTSAPEGTHWP